MIFSALIASQDIAIKLSVDLNLILLIKFIGLF